MTDMDKKQVLSLRLHPDVIAKLKQKAATEGITVTALIERSIARELDG